MTTEQQQRLEGMTRIGKTVWHGPRSMGTVIDEVFVLVNEYKHVIQKISLGGTGYAYRAGYWKFNGQRNQWAQATPYLTETEYRQLLAKAKMKNWEIFS
jgi:hypothetical protein